MSCGCIVGECPVCEDFIYDEDGFIFISEVMIHEKCKDKFMADKLKCTEGQVRILNKQEQIKQDIADLRRDMESTFNYYKSELNRLENLLKSEVEQ